MWSMTEPFLPDNIDRDTLFDGMPAASPQPVAAAEAIGAVNRLIGRLEAAESLPTRSQLNRGRMTRIGGNSVGQNGGGSRRFISRLIPSARPWRDLPRN